MKGARKWAVVAVLGCTPRGPESQGEGTGVVDRSCCSSECSVDVGTVSSQRAILDGCNVRMKGLLLDLGNGEWWLGDLSFETYVVLELERHIPVEGLVPGVPLEVELNGRVIRGGDRVLVDSINGVGE